MGKWSTTKVGTSDVVENQELTCSISLAKEPAAVSPQTCGSSGGTVTFTEMTGKTCIGLTLQPRVPQFGVTADECETQCFTRLRVRGICNCEFTVPDSH